MVELVNQIGERRAEEVPQRRHQRLKNAEIRAHAQQMLPFDLLHTQAFADGHRERVHAQSDAKEQNFPNRHVTHPPVSCMP